MDSKTLIRINKFLSNYNKTFDELTRNQKEKFLIIDDAIQKRLFNISQASATIKENAITPVTISKDTGILRPTFYQQPLFDAYIKSYMNLESKDSSEQKAQKRDKHISDLENEIAYFVDRDFDWAKKLAEKEKELSEKEERILRIEQLLKKYINLMDSTINTDDSFDITDLLDLYFNKTLKRRKNH